MHKSKILVKEKLISDFIAFFNSTFHSNLDSQKVKTDVQTFLDGPLLKYGIFDNSIISIIDNSIHGYLYMSGASTLFEWYDTSEAMRKGFDYTLQFFTERDIFLLNEALKEFTEQVSNLPKPQRLHVHFNSNFRLVYANQYYDCYQQIIPLSLDEYGQIHLMLAIVSDITGHKKDDNVIHKATLHLPGEPTKLLFIKSSQGFSSPFSPQEKKIMILLAQGKISKEIAFELNIALDTVLTHRKNMLEKANAKNVAHLVRLAVANSWM